MGKTPARSRPSARVSPNTRSRSNTPPRSAVALAPRQEEAASSSAPPPPRRSSPKPSAWRFPTPPSAHPASPSGSMPPAAPPAPSFACVNSTWEPPTFLPTPPSTTPWSCMQRSADRRTSSSMSQPSRTPQSSRRPRSEDWARINRQVPRLVDALPNGPGNYATVQVFLAGGTPEVMLHLRRAGLLDTTVKTVTGEDARHNSGLVAGQRAASYPPQKSSRSGRHRPGRRHHVSGPRPFPRTHLNRLLPGRQPRP